MAGGESSSLHCAAGSGATAVGQSRFSRASAAAATGGDTQFALQVFHRTRAAGANTVLNISLSHSIADADIHTLTLLKLPSICTVNCEPLSLERLQIAIEIYNTYVLNRGFFIVINHIYDDFLGYS